MVLSFRVVLDKNIFLHYLPYNLRKKEVIGTTGVELSMVVHGGGKLIKIDFSLESS